MPSERPVGYEFKHIKCDVDEVQAIIAQHQLFFWEVIGTNTIVSKESHLESGAFFESDTIYSVTTTERFSTIDFRRTKDISRLTEIVPVESRYFSIVSELENLGCSALDDYSTPPPRKFNWIIFLLLSVFLYVVPGVLYWRSKSKAHARDCAEWRTLKAELAALVNDNGHLLNV